MSIRKITGHKYKYMVPKTPCTYFSRPFRRSKALHRHQSQPFRPNANCDTVLRSPLRCQLLGLIGSRHGRDDEKTTDNIFLAADARQGWSKGGCTGTTGLGLGTPVGGNGSPSRAQGKLQLAIVCCRRRWGGYQGLRKRRHQNAIRIPNPHPLMHGRRGQAADCRSRYSASACY